MRVAWSFCGALVQANQSRELGDSSKGQRNGGASHLAMTMWLFSSACPSVTGMQCSLVVQSKSFNMLIIQCWLLTNCLDKITTKLKILIGLSSWFLKQSQITFKDVWGWRVGRHLWTENTSDRQHSWLQLGVLPDLSQLANSDCFKLSRCDWVRQPFVTGAFS